MLCLQLMMIECDVVLEGLVIDIDKVAILEEVHEVVLESFLTESLLLLLVLCFRDGLLNLPFLIFLCHFNLLLFPVNHLCFLAS